MEVEYGGETAAEPDAAAKTPGQAAREAFGELGADWYPGTAWGGLHEDLRAQWEAAAKAACEAHGHAVGLIDVVIAEGQLRDQLRALRERIAPGGCA